MPGRSPGWGWRLRKRYTGDFAAGYVNGMLAAGAGALVIMLLADWILPFVYNIGFEGFQASVLVWLFMGGLVALENMRSQGSGVGGMGGDRGHGDDQESGDMTSLDLSIIIVNWNTRDLLAGCLEVGRMDQIRNQSPVTDPDCQLTTEIFVVDNASTDGSAAMVRERFPWVRLIENAENVGFARANNQGLAAGAGALRLVAQPRHRGPSRRVGGIGRVHGRAPAGRGVRGAAAQR